MTSPRSAPKQLGTGQEMGAGNGSRFWISGWWRKILLSGMAGRSPRAGLGSAGPDLRAQGSSKKERLSRRARGMGLVASIACSGLVPLPPGLPERANLPPITPRFSPPSREPWLLTGQDHGQGGRIYTDRVSKIRKSFPDPVPIPPVPIKWVSARGVAGSPREVFGHGPGCLVAGVLGTGLPPDVRR